MAFDLYQALGGSHEWRLRWFRRVTVFSRPVRWAQLERARTAGDNRGVAACANALAHACIAGEHAHMKALALRLCAHSRRTLTALQGAISRARTRRQDQC